MRLLWIWWWKTRSLLSIMDDSGFKEFAVLYVPMSTLPSRRGLKNIVGPNMQGGQGQDCHAEGWGCEPFINMDTYLAVDVYDSTKCFWEGCLSLKLIQLVSSLLWWGLSWRNAALKAKWPWLWQMLEFKSKTCTLLYSFAKFSSEDVCWCNSWLRQPTHKGTKSSHILQNQHNNKREPQKCRSWLIVQRWNLFRRHSCYSAFSKQ